MARQAPRLLRNYRSMMPGRFHDFNQRVASALVDTERIPEWVWAMNTTLLPRYLAASAKYDVLYHEALLRSTLSIAERDLLQAQVTLLLDEIAAYLEAAAVRNPEILIASGFTLAKELKGRTSTKVPASEPAHHITESLDLGAGI
ncbi:hypothetical protein GMLC_36270 [Geomonas limicola]|uniref:Uncharacterized protein n=1 Tax=Geomonas limicola TaxID=2740186 RepID=A0A6V8NBP9_9BACT|nr:hypothetical protein [Geomonas limicola]GFO70048.1 hypothetical protein GMLC_36270 [Geomonas limicola]